MKMCPGKMVSLAGKNRLLVITYDGCYCLQFEKAPEVSNESQSASERRAEDPYSTPKSAHFHLIRFKKKFFESFSIHQLNNLVYQNTRNRP